MKGACDSDSITVTIRAAAGDALVSRSENCCCKPSHAWHQNGGGGRLALHTWCCPEAMAGLKRLGTDIYVMINALQLVSEQA